jgi:phage recombination protein Bet
MNDLEKTNKEIQVFEETCNKFLKLQNLNEQEKMIFMEIAKTNKLNPFLREIYVVAYGSGEYRQFSVITGYEVYLRRAEATGLLEYWNVELFGKVDRDNIYNSDLKATITIKRKDWLKEFVHDVYFVEYAQFKKIKLKDGSFGKQLNTFWSEKPITMLRKVAISQGFRLCFSLELSNMPYIKEEIQETEPELDMTLMPRATKEDATQEVL